MKLIKPSSPCRLCENDFLPHPDIFQKRLNKYYKSHYCIVCFRERQRERAWIYYKRNRKLCLERCRRYYRENIELCKLRSRGWYLLNRDSICEEARRQYADLKATHPRKYQARLKQAREWHYRVKGVLPIGRMLGSYVGGLCSSYFRQKKIGKRSKENFLIWRRNKIKQLYLQRKFKGLEEKSLRNILQQKAKVLFEQYYRDKLMSFGQKT